MYITFPAEVLMVLYTFSESNTQYFVAFAILQIEPKIYFYQHQNVLLLKYQNVHVIFAHDSNYIINITEKIIFVLPC